MNFWFLFLLLVSNCQADSRVGIKIIDTPPSFSTSSSPSSSPSSIPLRSPAAYTGPDEFLPLLNTCISAVNASYRYEVCPFINITQRDVNNAKNVFHLGVFGNMISSRESNYSDGGACNSLNPKPRSSVLRITCYESLKLLDIEEIKTCEYRMTLACPQGCSTPTPTHSSNSSSPNSTESNQIMNSTINTKKK